MHIFPRFVELLKEIDMFAEDYLNNVRTMSGETRKEHLEKIEKLFSKSKEFGDDKVQLAMQTYEMVSKLLLTLFTFTLFLYIMSLSI